MKNIYKFILLSLMLVLTSQTLFSQGPVNVPNPIRYYKLIGGNLNESISSKNGRVVKGTVTNYTDRFGVQSGATQLNNARIDTPDFFNTSGQYQNGFTISFWTYLDEHISKLTGQNEPWLATDAPYQAFYIYGGSATNEVPLLGLERRRDRLLLNWLSDINNQRRPWNIWLWDPVNFTNQTGWYHVVAVYEFRRTTIYMYKPNGEEASAAHYFTIPNLTDAREWGLGGHDDQPLKVMNDFKVFSQPFTYEQVRQLHANEAPPAGMYNVTLAANSSQFLHTSAHSESSGARTEILAYTDTRSKTFEWVFEPIVGKVNVYRIRMAYSDLYLHLSAHTAISGQSVEILDYRAAYASSYEWKVELDRDDNTFFIRSNMNDEFYLHTVGHSTSNGTALEILRYNSNYANTFKWKLNLIKTRHELEENNPLLGGLISPSHDPFLRLTGYFQSEETTTARETNLQKVGWTVSKAQDDAYTISNRVSHLYLFPTHADPFNRANAVQTLERDYFDINTRWVLEKPNKYYDKYLWRHARSRAYKVGPASGYPIVNQPLSGYGEDAPAPYVESWIFTEGGYFDGIVRNQAYTLLPGIYRISITLNGEKRYVTTSSHSTASSTPLTTAQFFPGTTNFDWKITFEEEGGKKVRDGSYLIQHVNSGRYMHIWGHYNSVIPGQEIQILDYHASYPASYKFMLQPSGRNKFQMVSTANVSFSIETKSYIPTDTQLRLGVVTPVTSDHFQWTFEKIADITSSGQIIYLDEPVEVTYPDYPSDYKPSH